ncbi:MAG: hypothetical protein BAA04_12025 [Firmicutes bacterium ZCTH02-B6]|nr:MAG: hypothetical protein BAA04_12025 [Firmicutes bacterium ZCTH02-B6]
MWWQQYKKEILGNRTELLILTGGYLLWTLFLVSRVGRWDADAIIAAYFAPVTGIFPLWTAWTSVQLYRQEWRENTSYLMLSLPVRARTITSAKLAMLLTGAVGFMLLFAVGGWLIFERTGIWAEMRAELFPIVPLEYRVKMSLLVFGLTLAALLVIALVVQFTYVFSRLFNRLRFVVMGWSWVLLFWLMGLAAGFGLRWLAFLPDFHLRLLSVRNRIPVFEVVTIESGPFVALALFVVALYALLNAVLERAVEV